MIKHILATAVVAAFCSFSVKAQSDANALAENTATVASGDHGCLMKTDDAAMKTLGLSAEQMTKVKALQAKCKAEGDKDAKLQEAHEKELQAALTPEQYKNWQKWCAETRTDDMKK